MQECIPYDCLKGASSAKIILKEAIPEETSNGHSESLAVTSQTGRIRVAFSDQRTQVLKSGKNTGYNNSSLTLQNTSVECIEMGIIRNGDSHLCFCNVPECII